MPNLTLMDVVRRVAPNGQLLDVAEILTETNAILEDMTFKECNSGMVNKAAIRTGIPHGTWRKLYGGVQPEKSTTEQIQDACGMLETYSEIDKALYDMSPNKAQFLLDESRAFLEGMSQTMAQTLIYGDVSKKEAFEGFASRYNAYGSMLNNKVSAHNVINGNGQGSNNTSIYLVRWGDRQITGLYPQGSKAGLQQDDRGQVTVTKSDGSMYEALRSHFKWDCGLGIHDWRFCVRIANIDAEKLDSAGEAVYDGANLIRLLTQALHRLPHNSTGKTAIYCNEVVSTALDLLAQNKFNVQLSNGEYAGKQVTMFRGIPIRRVDAILNTEAKVPAYVAA